MPLGSQVERRAAVIQGNREQGGEQRQILRTTQAQGFRCAAEPVEPFSGGVLAVKLEQAFQGVDGGKETAAAMKRRHAPLNDRRLAVMIRADPLPEYMDQTGLTDPRLADELDDLAHAVACLLPAIQKQADFLIAADQEASVRSAPALCRRLATFFAPDDAEQLDGFRRAA